MHIYVLVSVTNLVMFYTLTECTTEEANKGESTIVYN